MKRAALRGGKKNVPKSLDAFQNLKYTEPEKWSDFQSRKQDTLNRMDFADMGALRGKLGNKEVRQWYKYHDEHIPDLIDTTKPLEEQARQACELRNQYRTQARLLMKDAKAREKLENKYPNRTFENLLERKHVKYGLTGEQAYLDIIRSSGTTNKDFDRKAGLDENSTHNK